MSHWRQGRHIHVTWTRAVLAWLGYGILAAGWLVITLATGSDTFVSGIETLSNRLRSSATLFSGIALYYAGLPGGFVVLRAYRNGTLAERAIGGLSLRHKTVLVLDCCTVVLGSIVAVGFVLFSYLPRSARTGNTINLVEILGIESVAGLTGHRTTLLLILTLMLWTASTFVGKLLLSSSQNR